MKSLTKINRTLRLLTLLCLLVAWTGAQADWYVAGEPATTVFNGSWNASGDKMTQVSGSDYLFLKPNVASGTSISFKVTNGSWDVSYPGGNCNFTQSPLGTFAIKFNSSDSKTVNAYTITTWTIAGDNGRGLIDNSWSTTDTNYDMTSTDGDTYTLTLTNRTLTAGTQQYKVCGNHEWDVSVGSGTQNASLNITSAGVYDVTFTFKVSTMSLTATATLVSSNSFTVNVYDASGAPKVNGTTLSNTTSGTNCQWYTYTYEDTTLPSSVTVESSTGTTTTLSNPANGQTYYYAWNGYTVQAVSSDYNPAVRHLIHWPEGNQYSTGTDVASTTTDGINYTYGNITLGGNDWLVFTTAFTGGWDADKGSFYGASSNLTISEDSGNGTGVKGQTGIIHVTKAGIWSFTYNIITNAWTATRTGDLPQNTYTIHVIDYYGEQPTLYVWDSAGNLNGGFPGTLMSQTETSAAGETWYYKSFSTTASTINAIVSLGGDNADNTKTLDITGIAPGDYYIVYNSQTHSYTASTTMPEGKVQYQPAQTATVYVYDTTAPTLNGEAMTTEDGHNCVWYKGTVSSTSTLTANIAGSGTLNATLQDGETYYYYWNGTSYVATDIDYNPYADRSFTIYVATKNAPEGFVPYMYAWYYIGQSKKEPKGAFTTGQQVNNNLMILNQTTEINGYTYWYETFTGIDKLNVIIHNNDGVQTADILNISADRYIIFDYNMQNEGQPYYNEATPKPAPQNFTIHVIEKNGKTPYLYVWDKDETQLNGAFPGNIPSETETINDETWYKQTFQADDYINVIASLGGTNADDYKTADITNWTASDLYITYDSKATNQDDRVVRMEATAPTEQQQVHHNYVIYVRADAAPYLYAWNPEWHGAWKTTDNLMVDSEKLADGNYWYKVTCDTYAESINFLLHNNGGDENFHQSSNITQTEAVAYYIYDGATSCIETVEPTGKMYAIGQVAGNPWSATMGKEMTANADNTVFTLSNVQIIAGAEFAFASKMADENLEGDPAWAMLNSYRLTSNPDNNGQFWGVTSGMTDKTNPTPLELRVWNGADKNFKMEETAYYDITVDLNNMTVTIKRAQDALYMFYGNSESPYWKPNAGVPMISTDGITYTLTGVELNEGDTFQFTKQLSNSATDWNSIAAYRLGANAQGDYWEVTAEEIGIVLENALLLGSTKNFQMTGTGSNYRVVVNPTAKTVALYPMAQVLGSKVILHLEQTSNVTTPKLWAYDKERNLANTAYIHVDRPSRHEIATNRRVFYENADPDDAKTITTADGRKWWTWEVPSSIVDFWFTRGDYTYNEVDESNPDMTDIQWRKSGEIFLTWPSTGTALDEFTRDYYAAAAQEAAECAVMIEGHQYAYFTNTPGWDHVFCHAWATNEQGVNYDLLTPPAPYTGNPCYPGALCELVGYDKDGYEVWRIDLTEHGVTADPVGIIFNNGIDDNHNYQYEDNLNHDYYTGTGTTAAKEQTGDFVYSNGACYDYCGVIVLGRSLSNIITKGVIDGPVYTIEEDLVGVWFDENAETVIEVDGVTHTMYGALYCKDMNNFVSTSYVEKSLAKEGEIDYMLTRTNLMSGKNRYDQSNWVKLTLSTQYPGIDNMNEEAQKNELRNYVGLVLPAESVSGQLVNNVNPEMRLALQALPESNTANDYYMDPNVFVTSSFIGTQECEEPINEFGHVHRNTYFFVTPKPQEYAKITWAVYGGNNAFYVPKHGSYAYVDGHYEFMNEGDLDGYFPVQWDLQSMPNDIAENQAYSFHAIIRLADESQATTTGESSTLRAGQQTVDYKPYSGTVKYVVSPVDISSNNIITAVSDVTKTKTVKQVRYYNLTGMESSEPFDGVNVVVTTYSDGTKSTAKVLK